jgi:tetratricopeptide (TPR) repeat protein
MASALTLFEAVVALPIGEREAYLARLDIEASVRVELEAMLASEATHPIDLARPALGREFDMLAAARTAAEHLPKWIAGYRVLARLGEGSGGVVFRAEQERPRREVALKLLHLTSATPDAVRRFAIEVRALSRLRHPGIAHIYDSGVGVVWGTPLPYLAMELVDGMPLAQWRQTGPGRDACLDVVLQILHAIGYAHQQGVIHRDLKPSNIFIETAGGAPRVRILDFGVARITVGGDVTQTVPGAVIGTLPYMSPEQAAGAADIDTRTDVYAVGVLCYELLSGQRPIPVGADPRETLARLREDEPLRLGRWSRELGGDLELVVGKALARRREDRYGSAAAFADDLRRLRAHEPVLARRPTARYQARLFVRRHHRLVGALAVLALAFLVGFGGVIASAVRSERSRRLAVRVLSAVGRNVFELEQSLGTLALRQRLLESVREELDWLVAQDPGVPEYLALRADALVGLGNIEVQRGEREKARPYRVEAIALREQCVALRPDDIDQRARLATDLVRLGDLERRDEVFDAAVPFYERAHEIYAAVALQRSDVRALDDLAYSFHRLAHAAIAAADWPRAEAMLEEQAALAARVDVLAPHRAANLAVHRELWTMRGHLAHRRGDPAGECRHLETSLRYSRAWLKHRPDDTEAWVGYLGIVCSFADALVAADRHDAARQIVAECRRSLEGVKGADDVRVLDGIERLERLLVARR